MAGVTGLLLGSTGVATADVVSNNLAGATVVNVAPGGSVAVVFKLTPTSGDGDVDGCNALGSGKAELNVSAAAPNAGLTISPAKKNFQTCKKSASVTFSVGAGVDDGRTYAISAVMSGGQAGSQYTNSSFTLKVVKGLKSTTLGLTPSAATVDYGTPTLPLSATLLTGTTPVVGKTVAFEIEGSPVGTAVTDASGVATVAAPIGTTYDYTGLQLETLASFAGDATHATSSVIGTLLINKANQAALTIDGPLAGTLGQTLPITSSGGSGVSATSYGATGACSLNPAGTHAVLSSTGTCTITATKAGSTNYNAVTAAPVSFTVGKASQVTLAFTSPTAGTFGDLLPIVTSGGTGDGGLTYDVGNSTACAIVSGQLSITRGTGTCSVTATKAADDSYTSATSAASPVTINKAAQTLTLTGPTTGTFGQTYDITYTPAPGTGAVTFDAGSSTACVVEGTQVRISSGTGTCSLTGAKEADDDYAVANSQPLTVTASKASATLNLGSLTATYNGAAHPVSVTTTPAGLGDVAVTYDSAATAPTHADSYAVVASLDNANYTAEPASGTLVISPKSLTGVITAAGKEYDGTTATDVTPVPLSGVVGTDDVFLQASNGQFVSAGAGLAKTVTATISLSGVASTNYVLSADTASATAGIAKRTVTGAVLAADKDYDRTTTATTTSATLDRAVTGDAVSLVVDSASFALATAGEHLVTANLSLAGAAKNNYQLTEATATDLATIRALALTGSITAANKVYDGSTAATVTPALVGVLSGDVVSASAVLPVFADKNVGTGKAVTARLELGGADMINYTLSAGPYSTTADITAVPLTVTASSHTLTAGAAVPTITPSYNGFVDGEGVTTPPTCSTTYTVGAVGTFPSTCSGAVAANYELIYTPGVVSVTYAWSGFFQPIDTADGGKGKDSVVTAGTIFNKAKAGSTIPVKFSLGGDMGLGIFAPGYPKVTKVSCNTAAIISEPIDEYGTATTSGLKYDATAGQYNYSWKTVTTFANTCQRLEVKLADGNSYYAWFTFTK